MEEIADVVSVRRFKELGVQQKEDVYETLLNLSDAIKDIPKKSLRKTLDITFAVLQFKGDKLKSLEKQLEDRAHQDSQDDVRYERVMDENDKLKHMLEKLEDEKSELERKVKELTEELLQQQKRLQDALHSAEVSDKDSSDPLSELGKQEELLRNIARKNKHIKRLLKEIESLQSQNIEQSKSIIQLEKELQHDKMKIEQLKNEIIEMDTECKTLKDKMNQLTTEVSRLEGNITYLEEERENSERDLKDFIEKLEIKAQSWKALLDEKDRELKRLRVKLEHGEGDTCSSRSDINAAECDDGLNQETTKLMHALETRDRQIEQLEIKVKTMAEEMLTTTQLMNKLSGEREVERNPKNPRACCKLMEESLQAANKRCREISEMLECSEEDNAIKSKQAFQALNALDAYQRGDDGLAKAIRKCTNLEQKILSRDKQIRALVMELNSMHEIAHENSILRKRLNIPDDVVISAKNLAAKERNKEKIIDRLTLKLRASEESRLQLKLEKTELRKQLLVTQQKLQLKPEDSTDTMRIQVSEEIGEISDSFHETDAVTATANVQTTCPQCQGKSKEIRIEERYCEVTTNPILSELQTKYHEVLEENEILRLGMHEILDKLREYSAASDHVTIDTDILLRLLQALQTHSAPNTPKRLQHELRSLQDREQTLRILLRNQSATGAADSTETDELSSIDSARHSCKDETEKDLQIIPQSTSTTKRPKSGSTSSRFVGIASTPNCKITTTTATFQQETPSKLLSSSPTTLQRIRDMQQTIDELCVYRKRYDETRTQLANIDHDQDYARFSVELSDRVTILELELTKSRNCYKFLREDFDQILTHAKQTELQYIQLLADLKSEIRIKDLDINRLEKNYERLQSSTFSYSAEEHQALLKTKVELQTQIAFIVERIFSGQLVHDLQIEDNIICIDYGIITENFQLDYMTIEEFGSQQQRIQYAEQRENELQRKITQLEGLLEIAHDQIQSQQRLLNDITDNHIDLRHLVADLQSKTEENLLLAKIQRELNVAKNKLGALEAEKDDLNRKCLGFEVDLMAEQQKIMKMQHEFKKERNQKDVKIKFLLKSLHALKEKYSKFTPLIFLTNFVIAHTRFSKRTQDAFEAAQQQSMAVTVQEMLNTKLEENQINQDESANLIKLVKADTQCKLLEENLVSLQSKCEALEQQLNEQRLQYATEMEHWRTIEALFIANETTAIPNTKNNTINAVAVVQLIEVATNTDAPIPAERRLSQNVTKRQRSIELIDKCNSPIVSPVKVIQEVKTMTISSVNNATQTDIDDEFSESAAATITVSIHGQTTAEAMIQTTKEHVANQSVQTTNIEAGDDGKELERLEITSTSKAMVTQEELSKANKRIEELQMLLQAAKSKLKEPIISNDSIQQNGSIEKTIISFNTLLTEKDKSISKYQDLLQNERDLHSSLASKLNTDLEGLKSTVTNLNFNIKAKDMEIMELKTKLEAISLRRNSNEKIDLATVAGGGGTTDDNVDNSLNELSDEKIEEMFQQDTTQQPAGVVSKTIIGNRDSAALAAMSQQINDVEEKLKYAESTIKIKEEEIMLLKEKLKLCQEREKSLEETHVPELERFRSLMEEKDKHINDLMETLRNFHDDQQKFMKDTSNHSADQITKLSGDLIRTEATNKIYQTQVEALRRQLTSLTQREKQARELNQSLRNQLIKRPVVSIKTELNTRAKTENMQKRIQQLETELETARAQIQRQQILIETKRAKSASEVGLWEKQKRWQQNAEKFKAKLEETECTLEKTRALLQSARNTIRRLEKDKHVLELKLGRATQGLPSQHGGKCCRTPSCPNLLRHGTGKYTSSESPETYTGASSEYSSPSHSVCDGANAANNNNGGGGGRVSATAAAQRAVENHHSDLIEALKTRIELQQRKILAMEMEGKGGNSLTCEMEKLQEKMSAIEAQNIRLEAKNLQLQLDNDMLRQNDITDRMQKRIKHLEDYIIALKEELAQTEARRVVCKCAGIKLSTYQGQSAEQTILSLRNLVEKLRAENKYLKDARRLCDVKGASSETTAVATDSLGHIAALTRVVSDAASSSNEELKFIKDQLIKKTQLLQKAKVLLTRAAAKEKVLKEQLTFWKRKCSELQNVPVIDEISE